MPLKSPYASPQKRKKFFGGVMSEKFMLHQWLLKHEIQGCPKKLHFLVILLSPLIKNTKQSFQNQRKVKKLSGVNPYYQISANGHQEDLIRR
jgi:hypothetical protein